MASLFRDTKLAYVKTVSVDRTMTTATEIAKIPKGSRILGFIVNGVASDAGSTATLSFGSTTSSNEFVNGFSVLTGYTNWVNEVDSAATGTVLSADTSVYAKYAESGTASANGAWQVSILFSQAN
jgi:hypothetical protein